MARKTITRSKTPPSRPADPEEAPAQSTASDARIVQHDELAPRDAAEGVIVAEIASEDIAAGLAVVRAALDGGSRLASRADLLLVLGELERRASELHGTCRRLTGGTP